MRKIYLLLAMLIIGFAFLRAKEKPDAIYVWANGASTCYQLSKMPRVTYEGNEAVLTVDQVEQLRIKLDKGVQMVVTYGVYVPSDINDAEMPSRVNKNGKFISGGRLFIVCDGKLYDINGNLIEK